MTDRDAVGVMWSSCVLNSEYGIHYGMYHTVIVDKRLRNAACLPKGLWLNCEAIVSKNNSLLEDLFLDGCDWRFCSVFDRLVIAKTQLTLVFN